ncbi:DUF502 domain-containing protein [Limnohabitans sp.]|uniref:DUF502 domain-containing protein n=1 Tax=Limnohabitans sp. TaxID=1907725 RepID=UPI002AFE4ACC|nr:DUF502 domain-containing protein [Limnohabitans sp.]
MKHRSFKQYFITGLLVWLPLAITVWVLMWLVGLLDAVFLAVLHAADTLIPGIHVSAEYLRGVPGLGVAIVAVFIFLTGVFVANMFGQWWLRSWHGLMNRIPVVRTIYTSVRQVADTLFSGSGNAFSKALLVQYPRHGSWTIAFLTGTPGGEVASHFDQPLVSVYVPTTPNPTSGFFLMMPKADVIELDMSVDDALKYIISMGVVVPGTPAPASANDGPLPKSV